MRQATGIMYGFSRNHQHMGALGFSPSKAITLNE
jgi:hypothetical protein